MNSFIHAMKPLLASLFLATPVAGQSIDPISYGTRFCELRQLKVDTDAARRAAIAHALLPERPRTHIKADTLAAARYVVTNCPDALD